MAVSPEAAATSDLALSADDLDALLLHSGAGIVCLDDNGQITYASPTLCRWIGSSRSETVGRSIADYLHQDDLVEVLGSLARWTNRAGVNRGPEIRIRRAEGDWLQVVVDAVTGVMAEPFGGVVASLRPHDADAQLLQQLRLRLVNQERLIRLARLFTDSRQDSATFGQAVGSALEELGSLEWIARVALYRIADGDYGAGDGCLTLEQWWDAADSAPLSAPRQVIEVSGSAFAARLASLEEVTAGSVAALGPEYAAERDHWTASGVKSACAIPLVSEGRFGGMLVLEVTLEEIEFDPSHLTTVRTAAAVLAEAFRREEATQRLAHRASHDPITGLLNREAFLQLLTTPDQVSEVASVAVVDIEGFKAVNDALGHSAGDAVLRVSAERISEVVGIERVARLDGDEFALALPHVGVDALSVVGDVLARLRAPVEIGDRLVRVGAHAGVTAFASAVDAAALIASADAALEAAKSSRDHAGRVVVMGADLSRAVARRRQVSDELPRARQQHQLEVHYQPEIDLVTGRTVAVEALLRWQHPVFGLLPAGEFLAAAEQTAAYAPSLRWALEEACRQQAHWVARGLSLPLRINVSPRQLNQPGVVEWIADCLASTGVRAESITLELTGDERRGGRRGTTAVDRLPLDELVDLGVAIGLDDLGSGHWSLASMLAMPLSVVKVDPAMVCRQFLCLAEARGAMVVAEGVESPAVVRRLLDIGCPRGQGEALGAVVSAAEIERQLLGVSDG